LQRSKARSTIHRKPTQFEEGEDINKLAPQHKKRRRRRRRRRRSNKCVVEFAISSWMD
jgi:hypothetical protein